MAENSYRKKTPKVRATKLKTWVDSVPEGSIMNQSLPTRYIPGLVFWAILGVLYISNAHYAESMVRQTSILESEVENLRADYTTLRAQFDTYTGKQSEISKKAAGLGLEEGKGKVQKIIIKKGEY